jgi:hypothetical protein
MPRYELKSEKSTRFLGYVGLGFLLLGACLNDKPGGGTCDVSSEVDYCPSGSVCLEGRCSPILDPSDRPWIALDFSFRREINLRPPRVNDALSNFEAAIELDNHLISELGADASNLAFFDKDDQALPFEIECVNRTSGSCVAWVLVPTLLANEATTLFVYYGGSRQSQSTPSDVWKGAEVVLHLDESQGLYWDSTDNGYQGNVNINFDRPERVEGISGGGQKFAQGLVSLDGSETLDFGTSSMTASMWLNPAVGAHFPLYGKGPGPGYFLALDDNNWWFVMEDDEGRIAEVVLGKPNDLRPAEGEWVHLAFVAERQMDMKLRAYLNGAPISQAADLSLLQSIGNMLPTSLGTDTNPFSGLIDEVRLRSHAVSGDWIRVEHANLTDSNFVRFGPVEAR